MHSKGAHIPILRDGRKNLHDLHRYPSKEKKREEEIAHSNSLMIMWLKRMPSLEKKSWKKYVNIRAKHLDNYKVVQGNIKRALS